MNQSDQESAAYFITGDIDNMVLSLKIEYCSTTSSILPIRLTGEEKESGTRKDASFSRQRLVKIKWQQKLKKEFAELTDDADKEEDREKCPVFTYIDSDELPPELNDLNDEQNVGTYAKLTQRFVNFQQSKVAPSRNLTNIVCDFPTKSQQAKMRNVSYNRRSMFLMLYTGKSGSKGMTHNPNNERIICKITSVNNELLIFSPDIVGGNVALNDDHANYYSVSATVENCLIQNQHPNDDERWLMDKDVKVEIPETGIYCIVYLVEIVRTINIQYDGQYIEYMIEVADGIELQNQGDLVGMTQRCSTIAVRKDDVANFCHLFELSFNVRCLSSLDNVRLHLNVRAVDHWGRHFMVGCATVALPLYPGRHFYQVDCWRPSKGIGVFPRLGDYFLPNSELDPSSSDLQISAANIFSRIGSFTESSGRIELNIQCIRQSRDFISVRLLRELKLHCNIHWKIMRILLEFEEAKHRLLKAREHRAPIRIISTDQKR
ncbi:hypothetical protein AB6A40_000697 [Gnathostoma spinigerum]|uniref:Uncharacterized protein n=1 Tax=Gnathostoma spinigerum TaxID=75299 RepID=A0ABD6E2K0_9BILA